MANGRTKVKSPYQRHNKAPYRYSELYQRWRSAKLSGKDAEARRLGADHTRQFMGKFANPPAQMVVRFTDDGDVQNVERLAA